MLSGPTVKRLHRERAARAEEQRREQEPTQPPVGPPLAPRREPPVLPHWHPCLSTRSGLPFSTASLLGLHRISDVLVVEGDVFHLTWREPRKGDDRVVIDTSTRADLPAGNLSRRLQQACDAHRPTVCGWARRHLPSSLHTTLERLCPPPSATASSAIHSLIVDGIIPELAQRAGLTPPETLSCAPVPAPRVRVRALARGSAHTPEPPVATPVPDSSDRSPPRVDVAPDTPIRGLESTFAFIGDCFYSLVPFYGRPEANQFYLQHRDRGFLAMRQEHRDSALRRCDQLLARTIGQTLFPLVRQSGEPRQLYSDDAYSVLQTPGGTSFLCQRIPPYVVEGSDRRLYYFDALQLGLGLHDTSPDRLIREHAAMAMHPYRHMFVLDDDVGSTVCMPRPQKFYRRLRQLPVVEGLLAYLDAVRLTLCSGYFAGNQSMPYHSITSLGRPVLSRAQAHRRRLPVYPYHRHPRTRPKAHS